MSVDPSVDLPRTIASSQQHSPDPPEATATFKPASETQHPPTAHTTLDWPVISGHVIDAEIARGGMERVLAGRDLTLERDVAIKTLLPGANAERFVTESKIAARLTHPGIPPVHALGRLPDGSHYLVMKLIRGGTLEALLKERSATTQDLPRLIQVFEQIAQAVGFAHSQGIMSLRTH